jgi:hypothetical protein
VILPAELDEHVAIVVREIFDLYEQHRSALTVARELNERGRTTKRHRAKNSNLRREHRCTKDAVLLQDQTMTEVTDEKEVRAG